MERKKVDPWQLIGFVLLAALATWWLYTKPPPEETTDTQNQTQQTDTVTTTLPTAVQDEVTYVTDLKDSVGLAKVQGQLGAFAYSATLPSAQGGETVLENDVLRIKVQNRGGYISEVQLKEFTTYDSQPLRVIRDGNNAFSLTFSTTNNRTLNTADLFFEPTLTKEGENQVLSMRLKVEDDRYLEYRYTMKPSGYLIGFSVTSQGLNGVVNGSQGMVLDWKLTGYRQSKSASYENRYTRLTYQLEDGKIDKLGQSGDDDEGETNVDWISFRQHFFSSILLADQPFEKVNLTSKDLAEGWDDKTIVHTKVFGASIPLTVKTGEINYGMDWYFGPTDGRTMKVYERGLEDSIPYGWGIFGWINRHAFVPLFSFLSSLFPYGIAIIVMTILVRLAMSPVTYKSYLSQVKMKVLRPEIKEVTDKYKDDAMKRQQETMKLYNKAGVNPMAGCIPALIQLPIFYALFMFFPTAFDLRQKSFLWAEDLSSYDTIYTWDTYIPIISTFYGNHISLFPILAGLAIFVYMKMTTGQQMQQTQPGMPNMKFMIYLSPLIMMIFFNNYASGLSLYYFISNLITIFIMLVIKRYVIDEEKIHAKVQENKKKPRKQNRFQRKMQEMMEQAEQNKKSRSKR